MEVLGVAANIAAIIQIADRVIELCRYYIGSAADAPSDLRVILLETSSMRVVLDNLRFLQDSGHCPEIINNLEKSGGPVQGCQTVIAEFERLLPRRADPTIGSTKRRFEDMMKVLAWPLKESKARKLLKELSSYKATIEFALTTDITQGVKEIKHTTQAIQDTLTDVQQQQVYEWLRDTDPSDLHDIACRQYEYGTGDWILQHENWTEWTAGKSRCLWIHGIPGAGKTVLLSHLYRVLSQDKDSLEPGCMFTYYYCYYNRSQDEAVPLLKWIISEVCYASPSIPSKVLDMCKRGRRASVSQLLNILEMAIMGVQRAYVFVDALDESKPRDGILRVLRDLVTDARFNKIQILATSREYVEIEETMASISRKISMKSWLLDKALQLYIRSQLSKHRILKLWPKDLQEEVYKALADNANGMFRWVVCQLDVLSRLRYDRNVIINALASLPVTLDETYERLFLEIPADARLTVHFTLQWIYLWNKRNPHAHTQFPRDALNSIIHHSVLRHGDGVAHLDYNDRAILEFCGCLVTQNGFGHDTLSLAHYTVWEFLVSPRIKVGTAASFYVDEIQADRIAVRTALEVCADEEIVPKAKQEMDAIIHTAWDHDYSCVLSVCAFFFVDVIEDGWRRPREIFDILEESEPLVAKLLDASKPLFQRFELYFRCRGLVARQKFTDLGLQPSLWHHRRISPYPGDRVQTLINCMGFLVMMGDKYVGTKNFFNEMPQNTDAFEVQIAVEIPFRRPIMPGFESIQLRGSVLNIVSFWLSSLPCWETWFHALSKTFDLTKQLQMVVGHHGYDDCRICAKDKECGFLEQILSLREPRLWPRSSVTLLQIAVGNRDPIAVKHLLRAGADANETGDCSEPLPEKGTFFATFDHLHGLSPLYILRKVDIVYTITQEPEHRFSRDSAHRKGLGPEIEAYLLHAGATEFKRHCSASCLACDGKSVQKEVQEHS